MFYSAAPALSPVPAQEISGNLNQEKKQSCHISHMHSHRGCFTGFLVVMEQKGTSFTLPPMGVMVSQDCAGTRGEGCRSMARRI